MVGDNMISSTGSTSRRRSLALLFLAGTTGSTLCIGAHAQTEPAQAEPSNYLDEITVVARRTRDEASVGTKSNISILETPQSISVVTREAFEARGVATLNEALRYTAGVAAETRGIITRYDVFNLRGFQPPSYLDGMRLLGGPYSTPQVDPVRIERIEVLKGPASVLYGNSSPGGLINMISRVPSLQPFNEFGVRMGSFNLLEASFDFGGALGDSDKYLYRLVGLASQSDGFVDHTEAQRQVIQPSFTWRASEATELTLLGFFHRDPKGASFGAAPAIGTVLPNPLGKISRDFWDGDPNHERFDRTQSSAGYFLTHRFGEDWAFRQNLRYLHTEVDYRSLYGLTLSPDFRTLPRGAAGSIESFNTLTLDNQLSMSAQTGPLQHNALLGVDYQNSRGAYQQYFASTPGLMPSIDIFAPAYGLPVPSVPFTINTAVRREQLGVYGQNQVKLGALSLIASGRYDWYEAETVNRFTDTVAPHEQEAFTARIGLLYLLESGLAPYLSYSESFEPQTGADFSGTPFTPTTGSQVEVGVKYEPPGADALLTVSAYELKRQNIPTTDPEHPGFQVQTGEVTVRGAELEARATLARVFDLTGAYAYMDAQTTKSTLVLGGISLQGLKPAQLPTHSASLWGLYKFRAGTLAGLDVGAGVRYVAESAGNAQNTFYSPGFTLADMIVRYELGPRFPSLQGAIFSLQISNLLDRNYVSTCTNLNFCYIGQPRTAEFGLKYSW